MQRNEIIEGVIEDARSNFASMLERFYPAQGDNGINERNLTFQFAHAFLNRSPKGNAFTEIPLHHAGHWGRHVDAYVFDNQIGILIESKRLYSSEKKGLIRDDIAKLNPQDVEQTLRVLHEKWVKRKRRPKRLYVLILAENWNPNITSWWLGKSETTLKWDRAFLDEFHTASTMIKRYGEGPGSTLYWLYGYKQIR